MSRPIREQAAFFEQALLKAVRQVGAFSPTSRAVAEALARAALPPAAAPRRVLEVGAGTGAITRALVPRLGPDDRLDLCEINPAFAEVLRQRFAAGDARLHVMEQDVATLPLVRPYDAVVASLPLLNMEPSAVDRVFGLLLGDLLVPGGLLVYYDYWAKGVRQFLPGPRRERRRVREVMQVTRRWLERHEVRREVLLRNFPPAHLHVLRRPASD